MQKNIYAIVVLYNADFNLLKQQYDSLTSQVSKVIYVDNGSTEIPKFISDYEKTNKIILIKNDKNFGLGKAQNQGIEIACNENADFVLLLDQDSILAENMVSVLETEYNNLSTQHKVAAIGPQLKSRFDNSLDTYGVFSVGLRIKKKSIIDTCKVAYIIASGSLIPTNVFKSIGMINEKLFIDNLDLEWCLRANYNGFSIFQTAKTTLLHCLGNGEKNIILSHSPTREYYIIRNSILLTKLKHISLGFKIRKIIYSSLRIFYSFSHGYLKYLYSELKGLKDGYIMKV